MTDAPASDAANVPRHFVTALARGLEILRCFDRPAVELTVAELARRVGLSQPTTWRLCQTLVDCGYLVRDSQGGRLKVGAPALTLGYAAVRGLTPVELALPYLQRVTDAAGGSTSLSLRQNLEMIAIEHVDGAFIRPNEPVGWRAPLVSVASGLAVLAALPDEKRAETLAVLAQQDQNWDRHRERVDAAVSQYAQDGYVTLDRVMGGDYTAVAVPLFTTAAVPEQQWAISCGAIVERWSAGDRHRAGTALIDAQRLLAPALWAHDQARTGS